MSNKKLEQLVAKRKGLQEPEQMLPSGESKIETPSLAPAPTQAIAEIQKMAEGKRIRVSFDIDQNLYDQVTDYIAIQFTQKRRRVTVAEVARYFLVRGLEASARAVAE